MSDLDARMKAFTEGQITWPDLSSRQTCSACRFYYTADSKHVDKGRCDLVRLHHRVSGKQFEGARAKACPKFEAGRHPRNEQ